MTKFMTAKELADYLRVNRSTIYRLMKRAAIPGFRIGSEWRFPVDEVERWFKSKSGAAALAEGGK